MQVLRTLGAVGLVALVAACSSSSSKSGSTPAGNATAGTLPVALKSSHQGGGGSASDGLGHPVNVCALLPVATVASITGESLTAAKEDDTLGVKLYSCDYTGAGGVTVSVLADEAAAGYAQELSANTQVNPAGTKQITGLGDKAMSSILGFEALFGNVSISVVGLASTSDAASESLIRTLQPKL